MSQTFSTLSQAVQRAQADYGDISTWGYQSRYNSIISTDEWSNGGQENLTTTYARKYFIPYLRVSKDLGYSSLRDVGYDEGFVKKDGNFLCAYSYSFYVVILNNCVYVFFYYNNNLHDNRYPEVTTVILQPLIVVDVNGKASPNIIGRDIFMFELNPSESKFRPYGANSDINSLKSMCDNLNSGSLGPWYCAALIQKLGWKITDDYPW